VGANATIDNSASGIFSSTQNRFNEGGRPLFARDADKHMTPAPTQYRPDKFLKYEKRTKLQPHRANIPRDLRFADADPDEVKPGPGQYHQVSVNLKKKPAYHIDVADRKLLNHKTKSSLPGPLSYDTTTGLSMCSST